MWVPKITSIFLRIIVEVRTIQHRLAHQRPQKGASTGHECVSILTTINNRLHEQPKLKLKFVTETYRAKIRRQSRGGEYLFIRLISLEYLGHSTQLVDTAIRHEEGLCKTHHFDCI